MSKQSRRRSRKILMRVNLVAVTGFISLLTFGSSASEFLDTRYSKFVVHRSDEPSLLETLLNMLNMTSGEVGSSFALIAGVSDYPQMPYGQQDLSPAAEDLRKLEQYLRTNERFNEIVVLRNRDVTLENLRYFLEVYFPKLLKSAPKSRFLFAYSGHGVTENKRSYLLTSSARHFSDKDNTINLRALRVFVDEVVDAGHHVLVLINSCYGGGFVARRPFGSNRLIPKKPGAHAITAGGSGERAWHDSRVGSGSIFFEKMFVGLGGKADIYPKSDKGLSGDGIITAEELAAYLKQEVQISTNQLQNPLLGDISLDGGSEGGFFFLSRQQPSVVASARASSQDSNTAMGPSGVLDLVARWDWHDEDPVDSLCADKFDYRCAHIVESLQGERHEKYFYRGVDEETGKKFLALRIEENADTIFEEDDTDGESFGSYTYWNYLPQIGYYVVAGFFSEFENFRLINRKSGGDVIIHGPPVVSPDSTVLASSSSYRYSAVDVYRVNPEGLTLEWSMPEDAGWSARNLWWRDDNSLVIEQEFWRESDDDAGRKVISRELKYDAKKESWLMQDP